MPAWNRSNQLAIPAAKPADGGEPDRRRREKLRREINGLIGRGRTLQGAAREVIAKTGDADGVREACEFLLERQL